MTGVICGLNQERLLAAARDPDDLANLALCGVLARFPVLKLEAADFIRLLGRFPGRPPRDGGRRDAVGIRRSVHGDRA